jgi:hypothetical protein
VREIVLILHANDVHDPAPFLDLPGRRIAEPDMTYQACPLQLGQRGQRLLDRALGRPGRPNRVRRGRALGAAFARWHERVTPAHPASAKP